MTQLCLTLDALLESENSSAEVLECYFLEALYCSLGATLLENDRVKFDEFIKGISCLTTIYEEKELAGPGEIPGKGKICYHAFLNPVLLLVSQYFMLGNMIGRYKVLCLGFRLRIFFSH